MRNAFVIALSLVSFAVCAGTAGDLYASCLSALGTPGDLICGAYINGYVDGLPGDQVAKENGAPICMPKKVDTGYVRALIKTYLAAYPGAQTVDTGGAVAAILLEKFPCRKPN
jgi:hypothetical protein